MLKILVVQDDRSVARFLMDALLHERYEVVWVSNGKDATERFDPGAYDMVLTDCQMPFASGVEVVRHVRKASPGFPIVVLSASCSREDFETYGVDAYLEKPVALEELLSTVRRVVTARAQTEEERRSFPRRHVDLPVTIADDSRSWSGRILDISHDGLAIEPDPAGAPVAGDGNFRAYFRTRDGTPADLEVQLTRFRDIDGTVGFRFGPLTSRQERTLLDLLST